MREKPEVGGIQFPSKIALRQHVKNLLLELGKCVIDNSHPLFIFFLDLYYRKPSHLKYHPSTIAGFAINENPIKKGEFNKLFVITTNKGQLVVSWNDCCNGIDKSILSRLKEACRTSVRDQIQEKWLISESCFVCGKIKSHDSKFEVDHYRKEFCNIFGEFIAQNQLPVPTTFASISGSLYSFKPENTELGISFQQFHKREADLQLLCSECHRIKTKEFVSKS
jgi:hypothetical protein